MHSMVETGVPPCKHEFLPLVEVETKAFSQYASQIIDQEKHSNTSVYSFKRRKETSPKFVFALNRCFKIIKDQKTTTYCFPKTINYL